MVLFVLDSRNPRTHNTCTFGGYYINFPTIINNYTTKALSLVG